MSKIVFFVKGNCTQSICIGCFALCVCRVSSSKLWFVTEALTHSIHRHKSKKRAFTNVAQKWQDQVGKKVIQTDLAKIKKYCSAIRIIVHTQVRLWFTFCGLRMPSMESRLPFSIMLKFHYLMLLWELSKLKTGWFEGSLDLESVQCIGKGYFSS